jgi:hypothetical protein
MLPPKNKLRHLSLPARMTAIAGLIAKLITSFAHRFNINVNYRMSSSSNHCAATA